MALVYKGHDLLLHRNVAVKILRQQYVNDEEFIRRFRREAQSAASLSHPNVVSIYDVGQEGDTHYIVMEYVEGMTLNDLIKEKAPLPVESALHIANQICDALEHAHSNQIIHRDIKPHNILIGRNGRVKVTDFGIARAVTSSTITQTGSVVGSVHYFSPEHAKGTATGAKSDLYSLGIVLYQMLTGKLPFLGESPISVALKHLQEDVEEPRKVNPLIPQSVENIILKAVRKNPDERYQSAKEMLDDLSTALNPERRNEAKLLFSDDELDTEKTLVIPAIREDQTAHGGEEEDEDGEDEGKKGKKKKPWLAPLVWTGVLLVFLSVMWFGVIPSLKGKPASNDVDVPYVVDKTVKDAQDLLTKAGLKNDVDYEFSATVVKDHVTRQSLSGIKVKKGETIKIWVSKGPESQLTPNYVGRLWKDVKAELIGLGVNDSQINVDEKPSDKPEDTIIQQTPNANEPFDPLKTNFKFVVSKGREKVTMPDVIGRTAAEAETILNASKLKLAPGDQGKEFQTNFDIPAGRVIDTYPVKKGEDADPGMEIKLIISSGPPKDAGDVVVSLPLKAAKDGKSIFRIVVTDARYTNYTYKTLEVNNSEIFNVKVTVTKDKNATIQIYRDNAFFDTQTVTYQDYLDQKSRPNPTVTLSPSQAPATVTPTQTPRPSAGSGSPNPAPSGGR